MHGFGSWKLFPPIFLNGKLWSPEMATQMSPQTNESWEVAMRNFLNRWYSDAPTMEFYTSGTTGAPKRVELTKNAMRASAKHTLSFFNLEAGNRALLCLNPQYIGGAMMLVRAMEGGLHLDAVAPQNLSELFPLNKKYHFVAMAPLQAEKLTLVHGNTWPDAFQSILLGGTALSAAQMNMFSQLPSSKIWMGFGMTETASHIALQSIQNLNKGFAVLPGMETRINAAGCLEIRSSVTNNGWLTTNDLVELKGNFLHFLGRVDDQINSGGVKISPHFLEQKIREMALQNQITIPNFVISSIDDPSLGESVVLVSDQDFPLNCSEINEKLPAYHGIKQRYIVDELPKNEAGKIDRKELKLILKTCHPTTP